MKEQQQRINMMTQAEAVGINVASVFREPPPEPTSTQAAPAQIPTNPKHSKTITKPASSNVVYHDTTSGDREEKENRDLEEALQASRDIEQRRKTNAANLIGTNLGTDTEGRDPNFINRLIQETGASASSGLQREEAPETTQEPKGKPGRPKSNQNLEEAGPPTTYRPQRSRSPSKISKEAEQIAAKEKARINAIDKENLKMQAEQKVKDQTKYKTIEMEKRKIKKLNKKAEEQTVTYEKAIARVKQTLLRKETAQKNTQE
jgi:hypothetical protein